MDTATYYLVATILTGLGLLGGMAKFILNRANRDRTISLKTGGNPMTEVYLIVLCDGRQFRPNFDGIVVMKNVPVGTEISVRSTKDRHEIKSFEAQSIAVQHIELPV